MKAALLILILVHGFIHLLGFAKGFQLAAVSQLRKPVAKPAGVLWLTTTLLFYAAFTLLLLNNHSWWIVAGTAVLVSQVLIMQSWEDAKYGTIANVIILLPIIVALLNALPSSLHNRFETEVQKRLTPISDISPLSEEDIQHLPGPVQKYLHYVGAVGKPKVHNFRAVFHGGMKQSMKDDWMDIVAQQYNFSDDPARFFYIKSTLFGIPFDGLHMYAGNSATMRVKVASLFQVVDARGEKMYGGETVTLFNDMCVLAPATLIDKPIQWKTIDSLTVKATFTNKGRTIAALLTFDEEGKLSDFISDDRYYSADGKVYASYPWSTPIGSYRAFEGRMIPAFGEAVWHTPEGSYSYAQFNTVELEYNCRELR